MTVLEHIKCPASHRAFWGMAFACALGWVIGDTISDMLAGRNAGCRGAILVRTGFGASVDHTHESIDYVVADLRAAAELILANRHERQAPSRRNVS